MKNDLLNYDYEVYQPSKNEYVLCFNDKYFKIGELIFNILFFAKEAASIHELYSKLATNSITEFDLKKIIDNNIKPIFNSNLSKEEAPQGSYWIQKEILNAKQVKALASPFNFLFGKAFYPLLSLVVAANLYFAFFHSSDKFQNGITNLSLSGILISYFGLFIIIMLHELGHASASIKSGVNPRNIGLGFYTVLPVMYTDLTDAWKLSKEKKIKINLGGIYIQLFLNLFLISLLTFSGNAGIVAFATQFLITNTFIILLNLVPFLKFDGYWIISDLFSIPNMIATSDSKIKSLFIKKDPFSQKAKEENVLKTYFIWLYTILRVGYIGLMIVAIFTFITMSFIKTYVFVSSIPYLELDASTLKEVGIRAFNILIIYFFTRNYTKMFLSFISKKAKR